MLGPFYEPCLLAWHGPKKQPALVSTLATPPALSQPFPSVSTPARQPPSLISPFSSTQPFWLSIPDKPQPRLLPIHPCPCRRFIAASRSSTFCSDETGPSLAGSPSLSLSYLHRRPWSALRVFLPSARPNVSLLLPITRPRVHTHCCMVKLIYLAYILYTTEPRGTGGDGGG